MKSIPHLKLSIAVFIFIASFTKTTSVSEVSAQCERRVVGRVYDTLTGPIRHWQPSSDSGSPFSCGNTYQTDPNSEHRGSLIIANSAGQDSNWDCNPAPFYSRRATICGEGPHTFTLSPPTNPDTGNRFSCEEIAWAIDYPQPYNPPPGAVRNGVGCTAVVYLGPDDWDNHLQWRIVKPLSPKCQAPHLLSPTYVCNSDGTARVTWEWSHVLGTGIYRFEYDEDANFASPETAFVGATNTYSVEKLGDPPPPPSIIRYSRVKVETNSNACPTSWAWSNTVASSKDCSDVLLPPPEPPSPFGGSQEVFCNARGKPTNNPKTGKIYTAIGCIPVNDIQESTRFFLLWGIGIGGGISFLLIVYAGYLFATSRGNPKKVQAAKELMTAAIGGLVYLIFSVLLFEIVAVDLLQLPDFI